VSHHSPDPRPIGAEPVGGSPGPTDGAESWCQIAGRPGPRIWIVGQPRHRIAGGLRAGPFRSSTGLNGQHGQWRHGPGSVASALAPSAWAANIASTMRAPGQSPACIMRFWWRSGPPARCCSACLALDFASAARLRADGAAAGRQPCARPCSNSAGCSPGGGVDPGLAAFMFGGCFRGLRRWPLTPKPASGSYPGADTTNTVVSPGDERWRRRAGRASALR